MDADPVGPRIQAKAGLILHQPGSLWGEPSTDSHGACFSCAPPAHGAAEHALRVLHRHATTEVRTPLQGFSSAPLLQAPKLPTCGPEFPGQSWAPALGAVFPSALGD